MVGSSRVLSLAFVGVLGFVSLCGAVGLPETDEDCKWSYLQAKCQDTGYCSFQYKFGDLSLDQSCRLRKDEAKCPSPETVDDVDPSEYFSGRWYEIAAADSFRTQFEEGSSCITADYYFNKCEKNPVVVVNNGVQLEEGGALNTAIGKARQVEGGKFAVSFFGPFFGNYWIIHTESTAQDKYGVALVYSCSADSQDLWVLSRTPQLPEGVTYEGLMKIAASKGIDVDSIKMSLTNQPLTCEYPEPSAISKKPASDDECKFGATGCSPSAWCSWQFHLGDFTPNQACRQKPTECDSVSQAPLVRADAPTVTEAPVSTEGECPQPDTIDVNPADFFKGRWYEIATTQEFRDGTEKGLTCISADYYFNKCASPPVAVFNNGIKDDGSKETAVGKARQTGSGKFEVSFFGPFYGPYWVIYTSDAEDVALIFSCTAKSQTLWVLSRTPTLPSTSKYEDLLDIARSKGVDVDGIDMTLTEQPDTCPYPKPEEIANKPEDDSGCSLGLSGCSPSSWCSFQPQFGDFTPSQACRLKPTECEEEEQDAEPVEVATTSATTSSSSSSSSSPVVVFASVGAVGAVGVLGFLSVRTRRRSKAQLTENVYKMHESKV